VKKNIPSQNRTQSREVNSKWHVHVSISDLVQTMRLKLLKYRESFHVQAVSHSGSTVVDHEISKFSKLSADWWNPEGDMKTLHQINPVRVRFVYRDSIYS
jgi:hypothetical protein